ncbi:MAG: hypothetical protein ACI9OJ_003062, partial [Myxococcota bacterium]
PADCFDADACTVDLCTPDGTCANEPVPDPACCNTDEECNDSNTCTSDLCNGANKCELTVVDSPACCTSKSQCNDSESCTIDSCDDFQCQHVNTCCQSDLECNDGDDICTDDTCVNGDCVFKYKAVEGCCTPLLFEENFDDGTPPGWAFTNPSQPCGWKTVTNGKSKSAPGSMYFGNSSTKTLDCISYSGLATTGDIAVPAKPGPKLEFDLWYDIDFLDEISVIIISETGAQNVVYDETTLLTQLTWHHYSVALDAYQGQNIKIRLSFSGVSIAIFDSFEGAYVDNLKITDNCE